VSISGYLITSSGSSPFKHRILRTNTQTNINFFVEGSFF